jgi:hypothetical protein
LGIRKKIKKDLEGPQTHTPSGKLRYKSVKATGPDPRNNMPSTAAPSAEDRMVDMLDELELLRTLTPDLRQALATKNPKKMIAGASPWAIAKLISVIDTATSDSAKVAAIKDLLDRAGYAPVQKNLNVNVSDMTREELEARVRANLGELQIIEAPKKKTDEE